ncbi:hypothetical protein [Lactococcus lactis]|uniref:hypothetical protein n=1 Tax=Lactococcus lactis TaxID=1358 RepID=UPI0024A8D8AE|nr:hypothetical protein [Lactococcus lactis]
MNKNKTDIENELKNLEIHLYAYPDEIKYFQFWKILCNGNRNYDLTGQCYQYFVSRFSNYETEELNYYIYINSHQADANNAMPIISITISVVIALLLKTPVVVSIAFVFILLLLITILNINNDKKLKSAKIVHLLKDAKEAKETKKNENKSLVGNNY